MFCSMVEKGVYEGGWELDWPMTTWYPEVLPESLCYARGEYMSTLKGTDRLGMTPLRA